MAIGLQLSELACSFPGFSLGPLSLTVRPGQIVGLLGANGAGKTTLMNLVTQQLKPASGRITYGDYEPVWDDIRWKASFAYIRETAAFYEEWRAGDHFRFASRIYPRWDAKYASELVTRFRLDDSKKIGVLSKGNRVKLGLIIGLAARAEVLLLDEPTAGLDPTARSDVQEIIVELLEERLGERCVVLSSHIFEDLDETATDVAVLKDGQLAFEASQTELQALSLFRYVGTGTPMNPENRGGTVVSWQRKGVHWKVVRRGDGLGQGLADDASWVQEPSHSLLGAIYHGVQQSS